MGAKHGLPQSSSALALMHLTCGHYARFWGYHIPAMWWMWKSEQPPDAILSPTWSLTDVCGSLDILPAAHHKRTTTVLSLWWSRAASRLEASVRKTKSHLASCSGGRPWPTEHWPCIRLEEGSYSCHQMLSLPLKFTNLCQLVYAPLPVRPYYVTFRPTSPEWKVI